MTQTYYYSLALVIVLGSESNKSAFIFHRYEIHNGLLSGFYFIAFN